MAMRYGKEVTGVCTMCENEGQTHMHHIISQSFISKKASRWQLNKLSRGLEIPSKFGNDRIAENLNDNEIIDLLINYNPRNIIEVCVSCHGMTDSSLYARKLWKDRKSRQKKKSITRRSRSKKKCLGFSTKADRCKIKVKKNDYCKFHLYQAPEGHPQYQGDPNAYRPRMHSEGQLNNVELGALKELYSAKKGVADEYILDLFSDKTEAWRKIWIVENARNYSFPSGRDFKF